VNRDQLSPRYRRPSVSWRWVNRSPRRQLLESTRGILSTGPHSSYMGFPCPRHKPIAF
jgi:hypothetical protein